jgi:hypothetical protein
MYIPRLRKWVGLSLAVVGLWLAARPVPAQENGRAVTGAALYRQHCASCHGKSGRGDGLAGTALRPPPPDLTTLARQHSGVFPGDKVAEFIDGFSMRWRYCPDSEATSCNTSPWTISITPNAGCSWRPGGRKAGNNNSCRYPGFWWSGYATIRLRPWHGIT